MYIIRKITTIFLGIIFVLIEFYIKLLTTIPAIIVTVLLTAFGFKTVLESDSYSNIFNYCTCWNINHQFYLSAKVVEFMDPDID